jgi:predicted metal-dependent phosphoesterase TrpH
VVPGIEITAVIGEGDVHVLGYFLDPGDAGLTAFLAVQREARVERVRAMAERLAGLGKPIDVDTLLRPLRDRPDWAVGRPAIAQALVAAGHASTPSAAFQKLIGEGRPAWVPRQGATPGEVIRTIARAGGLASLAHPGLIGRDDLIAGWVDEGLPAIEVLHSEHSGRRRGTLRRDGTPIRSGDERRLRLSRRLSERPLPARNRFAARGRLRRSRSPRRAPVVMPGFFGTHCGDGVAPDFSRANI